MNAAKEEEVVPSNPAPNTKSGETEVKAGAGTEQGMNDDDSLPPEIGGEG